jgi:ABC-type transporter Mla subunit MlaD
MLVGFVMAITVVALQQDTVTSRDTTPPVAVPAAPVPVPPPPPAPPPGPSIEQIRYMEGLKTATRGITQVRDGLNRVTRTQAADSATRVRAAKRLGGLCGSGRSFIASGRPKMQATAYTDSLRILAKQLTTRLDSLSNALPTCEKTAGRDPATVSTTLTTRLKAYDDALLAFRNAQAALNKPDSTKTVSQQ